MGLIGRHIDFCILQKNGFLSYFSDCYIMLVLKLQMNFILAVSQVSITKAKFSSQVFILDLVRIFSAMWVKNLAISSFTNFL